MTGEGNPDARANTPRTLDTRVSQWLQHCACGTRPGPNAFSRHKRFLSASVATTKSGCVAHSSPPDWSPHGIGASQLGIVKAHHEPDFAKAGTAHGQGKRPVRCVPHDHGPVGGGRNERYQIFHRYVCPASGMGSPAASLRTKLLVTRFRCFFSKLT